MLQPFSPLIIESKYAAFIRDNYPVIYSNPLSNQRNCAYHRGISEILGSILSLDFAWNQFS